jgi:hypothetical protein
MEIKPGLDAPIITRDSDRRADTKHRPPSPHFEKKAKKKRHVPWSQRIRIVDDTEDETTQPVSKPSSNKEAKPIMSSALVQKQQNQQQNQQQVLPAGGKTITAKTVLTPVSQPAETKLRHENAAIPLLVRNDEKILKLWESATDEERRASELLCDFKMTTAKAGIVSYFDFADQWSGLFPNKKAYDRGLSTIKKAAKIAQVSESTIYSVLKTTKFYGRAGYDSLAKKAASNGIVLGWTTLRIIVDRLADNKEVRTEVEREIVQRKMTETQLNQLIDERAPETVRSRAGQQTQRPALAQIAALNTTVAKMIRDKDTIMYALDQVESEYDGSTPQSRDILKVCGSSIDLLSELVITFQGYHDALEKLVSTARQIVGGEKNKVKTEQELAQKAGKIQKQITDEEHRASETEKQRRSRAQMMGELSENDEDEIRPVKRNARVPVMDSLPDADDGYSARGNKHSAQRRNTASVYVDTDAEYDNDSEDSPAYDGNFDENENVEEDGQDHDEYDEDAGFDDDSADNEDEDENDRGYDDDSGYDDDDEDEDEDADNDEDYDDRYDPDIFNENGDIP